ncbi:reverse transcriptase, partial [Operophtera brumata]
MEVDSCSLPYPGPPPLPPDPPDPPDGPTPTSSSQDVTRPNPKSKRKAQDLPSSADSTATASKVQAKPTEIDEAPTHASIQTTWLHPILVIGVKEYSAIDKGPFIVQVSREVPDVSAGTTIRPIKFGQFLSNHKIANICSDGIKSVGRNRVSVEFRTATDANKFLEKTELLSQYKYVADIPTYNITRMGLVRNVPVDMSVEEFAENLEVPSGCGYVIKARRLNRKSVEDGKSSWVPTQAVVLTFRGQILPQRVFSFHTSLPVEIYQLPTIQCQNCCRFGHVKAQCRSKPRCYKCTKDHTGEGCDKTEAQAFCLHCNGNHFANSRSCPELERQRSIKAFMYAAKASRVLTKKKKLGWKSFCENLSPRTPPSIVWNQIKRFRGSCNTSIITSNDPFSWIDPFTDKLAPSFVPFIDSLPTPSSYITPSSVFDAVFSINELNLALDGLKDSSPGVDGIPYSFLSNYRKYSHLPHPVVQYQTFPLFSISFEALTFKPNIILDFGINKYSTNARNEFYERMDSEYNGWRTIYTDASKLDNTSSVGAAVWIPSTKIILNFKYPSVSSVFTGEATAILESIQFIKSHNLNNTIIFTDSKSSLQSILSNPFRSKSNFPIILQIRESLFRCHELGLNVVMAWIPSHTGIP